MTASIGDTVSDDTTLRALDFHRSMLEDERRTDAFLRAILETVHAGDVVLDIGTGTGVLALFACAAGAKKVYAVEQGPIIGLAREIIAANGLSNRVEFLSGFSTEIDLPSPVDVIVTETIGNMALDEGIVATLADARERSLRPGGRMIPQSLDLVCALVESYDDYGDVEVWSHPFRTFDFSALHVRANNTPMPVHLRSRDVVSRPATLMSLDLSTAGAGPLRTSSGLVVTRSAVVHGIGCWFDAEIAPGVSVSNAPPNPVPSWGQELLPVAEPMRAQPGDRFHIEIEVDASGLEWHWRVTRVGDGREPRAEAAWQSTRDGRLATATAKPANYGEETAIG